MPRARRISPETAYWLASLLALAGVLCAMAAGLAVRRLSSVAGFLSVSFGAASYVLLASGAIRHRAARLQGAAIPLGVRLTRPIWIPLVDTLATVGVAAALAAVAAAAGYPGVGIGVMLALGGMGVVHIAPIASAESVTFEARGLRVHIRRGEFFVPWAAVVEVGVTGPSDNPSASLRLVARDQVMASVSPNTERNRWSVERMLGMGSPGRQALTFNNWTAGLDGATLARTVRELMGKSPSEVN